MFCEDLDGTSCLLDSTISRTSQNLQKGPYVSQKNSASTRHKKTSILMPKTLLKRSTQTSPKTTKTHTEKKNLPRQRQSEDDEGKAQVKSKITWMGNACRSDWSEKWRTFWFLPPRFFPFKRRSFRWRSFIGFDHQTWWITSQMVADWRHLTWTLGCPGGANISRGSSHFSLMLIASVFICWSILRIRSIASICSTSLPISAIGSQQCLSTASCTTIQQDPHPH